MDTLLVPPSSAQRARMRHPVLGVALVAGVRVEPLQLVRHQSLQQLSAGSPS